MPSLRSLTSALSLSTLRPRDDNPCVSFGVDFQDGGNYFQNSLSNDNFTFVSQFEGCQPDQAFNILIDSAGDQTLCTNTSLTPSDTNQLASCGLAKSNLTSGDWSVVIISNNGNAEPIAYQRDFSLSVGPQQTSTYTPTVTNTIVSTPVVNVTSTIYTTTNTTLQPATVTSPSVTKTPTKIITPQPVTVTSTSTVLAVTQTKLTVEIHTQIVTKTASCKLPDRASTCDPWARIRPTIGAGSRVKGLYRRDDEDAKRVFVEERRARLQNRAPDAQPLIVTDTDTSDWVTMTSTSTAPAITAVQTTEVTVTSTITPSPVIVLKGKATASTVTITAPTSTKYKTRRTIATTTVVKTLDRTYTLTTTTTPAAVSSACRKAGGILH